MRFIRGILALGTLALFVIVPPMSFGASSSEVHAQEDPQQVVEDFFDAVDAGDVDGAVALLDDAFIFTQISDFEGSFAVIGVPAFEGVIEEVVAGGNQTTLSELAEDGGVVTGVAAFSDDSTDEAGVDRYLQPFEITVNDGGLISRMDFTYDETDAQTVEYLEWQADQDGDDGEGPPSDSTIPMAAQSGTNQTGEAFLFDEEGITVVGIFVEPGAEGVLQPAHLHTGTCEAPGPILQPLASVLNGVSFTLLSPFPMPLANQGLILNVHKSAEEVSVYTSCGVIQEIFVDPTPTAPAAPAPSPTVGTGVVAPDTGSGTGESDSDVRWLFALVVAGATMVTGGALTLVKRLR